MIVYNITANVSWVVHNEWLRWMQEVHIPEILATGWFFEYRILKLLDVDDIDGPTYAIQFHTLTMDNYRSFVEKHEALFRQKVMGKWRDQVVAFSSVMEVLH